MFLNDYYSRFSLSHLKDFLQDFLDESGLKTAVVTEVDVTQDLYRNTDLVCVLIKVSSSENVGLETKIKKAMAEAGFFDIPFCEYHFYTDVFPSDNPFYMELKIANKNKEENKMKQLPEIKKIIHSGDYTHIMWEDGTKTSVKRAEGTPNDPYSAFAQAVLKKLYGSTENAKFEHDLRQNSDKVQKKILAQKELRREKQRKAEQKKIDWELKRQESELAEKEEQVKAIRAKRQSMFKRNSEV